jgi:hypothetical protein
MDRNTVQYYMAARLDQAKNISDTDHRAVSLIFLNLNASGT